MTNWREVIEKEGILPNGLSPKAAVTELSEMLRSPEPATRDEMAYVALTRVIPTSSHRCARRRTTAIDRSLVSFSAFLVVKAAELSGLNELRWRN